MFILVNITIKSNILSESENNDYSSEVDQDHETEAETIDFQSNEIKIAAFEQNFIYLEPKCICKNELSDQSKTGENETKCFGIDQSCLCGVESKRTISLHFLKKFQKLFTVISKFFWQNCEIIDDGQMIYGSWILVIISPAAAAAPANGND